MEKKANRSREFSRGKLLLALVAASMLSLAVTAGIAGLLVATTEVSADALSNDDGTVMSEGGYAALIVGVGGVVYWLVVAPVAVGYTFFRSRKRIRIGLGVVSGLLAFVGFGLAAVGFEESLTAGFTVSASFLFALLTWAFLSFVSGAGSKSVTTVDATDTSNLTPPPPVPVTTPRSATAPPTPPPPPAPPISQVAATKSTPISPEPILPAKPKPVDAMKTELQEVPPLDIDYLARNDVQVPSVLRDELILPQESEAAVENEGQVVKAEVVGGDALRKLSDLAVPVVPKAAPKDEPEVVPPEVVGGDALRKLSELAVPVVPKAAPKDEVAYTVDGEALPKQSEPAVTAEPKPAMRDEPQVIAATNIEDDAPYRISKAGDSGTAFEESPRSTFPKLESSVPSVVSIHSLDSKGSIEESVEAELLVNAPGDVDFQKGHAGTDGWVNELFQSELYCLQRDQLAARHHEKLHTALTALDSSNGTLTHAALAGELGMPSVRVRGLVATFAQVLNIDGYSIISDDGEHVRLDGHLARLQFGLED